MIKVVNKHNHTETECDFYIGRGSILGNPFTHIAGTSANMVLSSRNDAVEAYIDYLEEKLNNEDEQILTELQKILEFARYNDVNLVCYCTPQRCHGTVIKKLINQKLTKDENFL